MILDVDEPKRRISLGLKQAQGNPWDQFLEQHPPGSTAEGEIRNITEFGLFIGLGPDLDGMVHMSDLSWELTGEQAMANYHKGDTVQAKVLDVDIDKERISLGIKQLGGDPLTGDVFRMGQTHTHKYLPDLLGRIESGQIDPRFVITHRASLDEAPDLYKTFRDKHDGCVKVVLNPWA